MDWPKGKGGRKMKGKVHVSKNIEGKRGMLMLDEALRAVSRNQRKKQKMSTHRIEKLTDRQP